MARTARLTPSRATASCPSSAYDFGLTGSRFGCGEGQCGACTVLLDGAGARSCVTRVGSVGAKAITTIEALADGDRLHPVQQAFLDVEAFQCGYCTSGMVMAAVGLLEDQPEPVRSPTSSRAHGSQRLPLRHVSAHRQGRSAWPRSGCGTSRRRSEAKSMEPERYELSEARRYTFELERRDFMRLFGGGLVVMVAAADLRSRRNPARARPQGRGDTPDLAAWLHIDETGRVHVCTGKVEIGQNIRTSLAQTVADELRVPIASITMVMADTDKTPFDQGTFGSQTTPRMAPQLAKAAATAREMLIDQAAATLAGRSRDADGARRPDRRRSDGRALTYGELTKGQALSGTIPAAPADRRRATVAGPRDRRSRRWTAATSSPAATSTRRTSSRPACSTAAIVRPDGYGGTLVSVDDAKARAMAGRDRRPRRRLSRRGRADRARAAARAAAAIAGDVERAGRTAVVRDDLRLPQEESGRAPRARRRRHDRRCPPACARTFEASYRIPYIAHAPLEPRAAVAEWQDGKLTVWTGTQRPFGVRTELAEAFRIAEDRVRVIVPDMGSAYGGKHTGERAIEAARAREGRGQAGEARLDARGGVRVGATSGPPASSTSRAASTRRGRIVAWAFDNWNSGSSGIQTPYDIALKPTVVPRVEDAAAPGFVSRARGDARTTTRARCTWTTMARALGVDARRVPHAHLKDDRMRAVLTRRRAEDRLAEAVRRRAFAGHRVRHREGGLRRDRGRSVDARRTAASRSSASSSPSSAARS